ncbi:putative threonine/homoserine efflux transporter [Pseudomonas syringae pv. atrofaciens]|nr:putative threonine/homoserine efflux transporter [Pseudomonas syringae pv. atrofaciens]
MITYIEEHTRLAQYIAHSLIIPHHGPLPVPGSRPGCTSEMSEKSRNIASALFPLGLLMIAMISIQSGASLAKSLFPVVGAQGTTTLRLVFASLILVAVLRPWRANLTAKSLRTVVIYGIALGCMNLLFYMSLQTVPLGIAVALEFTGPLAVALLSSRKPIDFLWVTLAVIGLLLLIPLGTSAAAIDLLGAGYALGAGVCWAAYIVFGHKAGADNGVQTAALGVVIAALFIGPIGVIHAGSALLDISLIPAALGVAILSTALPYSLEMIALTRMSARTFGTLASLEPVFAALSGLVFLHESLSLTQWLAIGAIIFASIGATLGSANSKPQLVPAD